MDDQKDMARAEIVRHVDAPVGDVFDAMTDQDRFGQWWGPHGFDASAVLDPRPGGRIELVMRAPDGSAAPVEGSYGEISRPSLIEMNLTAHGADGGGPMIAGEISIDLTEDGNGTKIRVDATGRALRPEGRPGVAGMREGWTESLERLQQLLEDGRGSTLKARHET